MKSLRYISFAATGLLYAWLAEGKYSRKILLFVMICLWLGRQIVHLWQHFSVEEASYPHVFWGNKANSYFLFVGQSALIAFLSLPFLFCFCNSSPHLSSFEWIGMAVWLIGFVGESWSDFQFISFKSEPANREKACDLGFWRYTEVTSKIGFGRARKLP